MPFWLDWILPEALLTLGRTAIVDALRSTAGSLNALADAFEPPPPPVATRSALGESESPPPGIGTRERIGEALQRARMRYDAVDERSGRAQRTRSRPRPRGAAPS